MFQKQYLVTFTATVAEGDTPIGSSDQAREEAQIARSLLIPLEAVLEDFFQCFLVGTVVYVKTVPIAEPAPAANPPPTAPPTSPENTVLAGLPNATCPHCNQSFEWDDYYETALGDQYDCPHCNLTIHVTSCNHDHVCNVFLSTQPRNPEP